MCRCRERQCIEASLPDVFHRPPADCGASSCARDPKTLLNTRVQAAEIRTERTLVDRSQVLVSSGCSSGGRRRQRRADGSSRSDIRPMTASAAIERLRTRGLNGPRMRSGAAKSTTNSPTAIDATVSSHGQRRWAKKGMASPKDYLGRTQDTQKRRRQGLRDARCERQFDFGGMQSPKLGHQPLPYPEKRERCGRDRMDERLPGGLLRFLLLLNPQPQPVEAPGRCPAKKRTKEKAVEDSPEQSPAERRSHSR